MLAPALDRRLGRRSACIVAVLMVALSAVTVAVWFEESVGSEGRRELLGGDGSDARISAVAGALNVFKSIAAGSPVPTTCWEPPCAPRTVAVRQSTIPHRLSEILKGVRLLEGRLQTFEAGVSGWHKSVQGAEKHAHNLLADMSGREVAVYRAELDARRFLTTPGPRGPPGFQGLRGVPGWPGAAGLPGFAGARGPEGESGDRGNAGAPGPPGISGEVGPVGMQGPLGDEGQRGQQGPPGQPGARGVRGRQV